MLLNYLLIKTYDRDDYLARLCYESWRLAGYEGEVIFYCQRKANHPFYDRDYVPKWIQGCGRIMFHEHLVSNYGGQGGAAALIDGLRRIHFKDADTVISCDTDVIIKKNPLPDCSVASFCGSGGKAERGDFYHFGGACLIMKGAFANILIRETEQTFSARWTGMCGLGIEVCDDTYLSYSAKVHGVTMKNLNEYWIHDKFYEYEPRTDWANIIKECQK